jgi:hypothetical protein
MGMSAPRKGPIRRSTSSSWFSAGPETCSEVPAYSGEGRHGVRRRGRAERCFRSIYLWITKFGSAISHAETAWTLGSCPEQAPVRITTHPPDDYYSPAACPVPAK